MSLTGYDIATLRTMLNWSREEFGAVLATTQSAVFRWEQYGPDAVPLDPRNRDVLKALRSILDGDDVEAVRARMESVRRGGGLRGLFTILSLYFEKVRVRRSRPRAAPRTRGR